MHLRCGIGRVFVRQHRFASYKRGHSRPSSVRRSIQLTDGKHISAKENRNAEANDSDEVNDSEDNDSELDIRQRMYSIFHLRRPRDAFDGVKLAAANIATGTFGGAVIMFQAPIEGYKRTADSWIAAPLNGKTCWPTRIANTIRPATRPKDISFIIRIKEFNRREGTVKYPGTEKILLDQPTIHIVQHGTISIVIFFKHKYNVAQN